MTAMRRPCGVRTHHALRLAGAVACMIGLAGCSGGAWLSNPDKVAQFRSTKDVDAMASCIRDNWQIYTPYVSIKPAGTGAVVRVRTEVWGEFVRADIQPVRTGVEVRVTPADGNYYTTYGTAALNCRY